LYIRTGRQTQFLQLIVVTAPKTNLMRYVHLPTYLPTYLPTHPTTYLPTYPPTHLPTYLPIYLPTYLPTYLWLYSPCGPWPLFQFLNPLYSRMDSLDGGSASRKAVTHTQTQNIRTQTSMPRVEFEPTIPAFKRAKTVHTLDRAANVIGA
jgi:hypothetical protein